MKWIKKATGQPQFDILASLIVDILIFFHSSADFERIFSFVIKTKTAFHHSTFTKTLLILTMHKVSLNTKGTTATFSAVKFQYFPALKAQGVCYLPKTHEKVTLRTIQC